MFDIYVSELVMAEIDATKNIHLKNRLLLESSKYNVLSISEDSKILAEEYVKHGVVPSNFVEDALHIAIATMNSINYLVSWNFEHIVKLKTRKIVSMVNSIKGYPEILILTPAELI